jgi:hypothetical protein
MAPGHGLSALLDVRWVLRHAAHGGSIGVAADIQLGMIACPLVTAKDRWVSWVPGARGAGLPVSLFSSLPPHA